MRAAVHPLTRVFFVFTPILVLPIAGCGTGDPAAESADATASQKASSKRDILSTDLQIDLAARHGRARVVVGESNRVDASFEAKGLEIESVSDAHGPVPFKMVSGRLDVSIPAHSKAELSIEYRFQERKKLEGALENGSTFLWPYYCGNLFPCHSDPSDGLTFTLELTGVPAGDKAIYPKLIPNDAPSYMVAWATGDYTQKKLGKTAAGTNVSVWYLPGESAAATKGTAHLTGVFAWFEKKLGPYQFGSDVGSVSADWGAGAFGGMEHHPYWHVSQDSMGDEETHAHEAAHGWFGDGVRLRCWEDLTLSEGTVTYLAARALEDVAGTKVSNKVWAGYQDELAAVVSSEDRLAWPGTCGKIDVLRDLWNNVPYMKGAFFYRAVEEAAGREALDRAIARFYQERKGTAAGMQDMLDTIQDETGFDPTDLAHAWLQSMGTPE